MKSNYSEFLKETMESIGGYGKVNPELMSALSTKDKKHLKKQNKKN